jgi:hypothetical protein
MRDETIIRRLHPTFPGWEAEIETYRASGGRSFKTWLRGRPEGINLENAARINDIITIMQDEGLSPGAELVRKIKGLVSDPTRAN